jgi:hypothetical protein
MTPEDRELLLSLRRQQQELHQSLKRLQEQLDRLETRTEGIPPPPTELPPEFPPLPTVIEPPVELSHETLLPPLPTVSEPDISELPPLPPLPVIPKPSLEFQIGRWLTRIGAVFLVLSIVFFAIWADVNYHLHELLGRWGKLGIMGMVSMVVITLGQWLECKNAGMVVYGRTLMAAGLAGLYFTLYAAHYLEDLAVIHNVFVAGFLLLLWSAYVFFLAEHKKSEILSFFAITLAYFSSAINPLTGFTMVADLLLAVTAVIFLLRNGWAALSYLGLLGTYLVLLRRLVIDENGELVLDTSRTLSFWPHAIYLLGAWLIFTAAVLLSTASSFRSGKRLAFLSLNNGGLAGLLALTAYIAGYGYSRVGWTLLATGGLLLVTSRLARWGRIDTEANEMGGAYLGQGLALLTGGIMVVYTGVSRGVLLAVETFFLGLAGTFSRNIVLTVAAYVAAFFTTVFLIWEIALNAHHPWLLGAGSAGIMFANAWGARRDVRHTPETRRKIVLSSSYYCALALGLIFTAMSTELSDDMLPPALAFAALALTFSIYLFPLYELPPIAQTFLIGAQAIVLFPADTGEGLSRWSTSSVAAVTLVMITWWSRQRVTRYGLWLVALNFVYALALVGLTYHAIRPYVNSQSWMISASLLSVAFLSFGAFTRIWPLAIMGQVFLAVSIYHFFLPPGGWDAFPFPWTWWAMAVPIAVVFSTSKAMHEWLRVFPEITDSQKTSLRALARFYQGATLALVIRWIAALVPQPDQISTFFFLGTLLLVWNVRPKCVFGLRCSFVLTFLGMVIYLQHFNAQEQRAMATFVNGLAVFAFLLQPGLLRRGSGILVSEIESWILIFLSAVMGWLFVSAWVITRIHENYLTMGWSIYALFLFFLGLLVSERRQRWCGLAILVIAILRVAFYDIWGFSNGYRVLTFVVLTIITLGLGFIYARFADRLKMWL